MAVITIVGAGQMGSAMCFPAQDNGHEVRLVGTPLDRDILGRISRDGFHVTLKRSLPAGIRLYQAEDLGAALEGADLLIGGISSFGVDWFSETVLPLVPDSLPVLCVTKGLLNLPGGALLSYLELYARRLGGRKLSLNAVGGPCTSYELADRDPTLVCFCGEDPDTLRRLREMLRTDYYHISLTTDVPGLECAAALKNAYALGVSLAIGLAQRKEGPEGKLHYNSQAALFTQGVREMRSLLSALGARPENIDFGAGDLYVTVFGGRTRLIGTLLGRGLGLSEALEQLQGVTLESLVITGRAAAAVRERIARGEMSKEDYPLLLHCDDIITRGIPVDIPWGSFEREYGRDAAGREFHPEA